MLFFLLLQPSNCDDFIPALIVAFDNVVDDDDDGVDNSQHKKEKQDDDDGSLYALILFPLITSYDYYYIRII